MTSLHVNNEIAENLFHDLECSCEARLDDNFKPRSEIKNESPLSSKTNTTSECDFAQLRQFSNAEIESELHLMVADERSITQAILHLIREADDRKLYLERGFSSIYQWLIEDYNYSQSAAHRRIQAARLIKAVPAVSEKILSGEVNLTTMTQVQGTLQREEKRSGQKIDVEAKEALVKQVEGKTIQQTEAILAEAFPEAAKPVESFRQINVAESKMTLTFDAETKADLTRVRELLSHAVPGGSWKDIISYMAKDLIKRRDPLVKAEKDRARARASGKVRARGSTISRKIRSWFWESRGGR